MRLSSNAAEVTSGATGDNLAVIVAIAVCSLIAACCMALLLFRVLRPRLGRRIMSKAVLPSGRERTISSAQRVPQVQMPELPSELGSALAFELGVGEGGEVSETQKVDLLRSYLDGTPYRSPQLQANVDALPLFVLQHAARLSGGGGGFGSGGAGGGFGGGAEMLVVRVQIPPGGAPGKQMSVTAPDGGEHTVTIPQGKHGGDFWEVAVPPLAPPPGLPPPWGAAAAAFAMSAADAAVMVEQLALLKENLDAHLARRATAAAASRSGGARGGGSGGELPAELHPRVAASAQSLFLARRGHAASSEVEALELLRSCLDEYGVGRNGSLRADGVASLPLAVLQAVGWGSANAMDAGAGAGGGLGPTATLEQLSLLRTAADVYLTAAAAAAATEGAAACGGGRSRQLTFAPPPPGLAQSPGGAPPPPPPVPPPVLDAASQLFAQRFGMPAPSDHEAVVFLKKALDDCLGPPGALVEGPGGGALAPTAQFGGSGGAAAGRRVSLGASQCAERLELAKGGGAPLPPIAGPGLAEVIAGQGQGQAAAFAAFGAPAEMVLARMPEPVAMALTVQFETVYGEPPAAPKELIDFARSVVDEYDERVEQVEAAGGGAVLGGGDGAGDPFGKHSDGSSASLGRRTKAQRSKGARRVSLMAGRIGRSGVGAARIGPASGFETRQQSPERFEREAAQVSKVQAPSRSLGSASGDEKLHVSALEAKAGGSTDKAGWLTLALGRGRARAKVAMTSQRSSRLSVRRGSHRGSSTSTATTSMRSMRSSRRSSATPSFDVGALTAGGPTGQPSSVTPPAALAALPTKQPPKPPPKAPPKSPPKAPSAPAPGHSEPAIGPELGFAPMLPNPDRFLTQRMPRKPPSLPPIQKAPSAPAPDHSEPAIGPGSGLAPILPNADRFLTQSMPSKPPPKLPPKAPPAAPTISAEPSASTASRLPACHLAPAG